MKRDLKAVHAMAACQMKPASCAFRPPLADMVYESPVGTTPSDRVGAEQNACATSLHIAERPMYTTVTGIFPNQEMAALAARTLWSAGFQPDQVRVVNLRSPDRHEFIGTRTRDTKRAVLLGVVLGGIAATLCGFALADAYGFAWGPVVFGLTGAAGGALLGFWVGNATTSQIKMELKHMVDSGTVLVSMTADSAHKERILEVLAREGGANLVTSAVSFKASVMSATA